MLPFRCVPERCKHHVLRGELLTRCQPGPACQYEEEEKSSEFSDAWWIASDRDVLPKFSLFEHELRSHVPFCSSCEVCVRARGLRKPATGLRCTRTRYSLISFGWVAEVLDLSAFKVFCHWLCEWRWAQGSDCCRHVSVVDAFWFCQQRLLVYLRR